MEKLSGAIKNMKFVELVLIGLTLVALIIRSVYAYRPEFFLLIFSIGLMLAYFPFGFYILGKPSEKFNYTIPVILGFIYALGVMAILFSSVNIGSYRYPLLGDFFVLVGLVIFLLYKMRSDAYPAAYINANFIRIAFIIVASFIILIARR